MTWNWLFVALDVVLMQVRGFAFLWLLQKGLKVSKCLSAACQSYFSREIMRCYNLSWSDLHYMDSINRKNKYLILHIAVITSLDYISAKKKVWLNKWARSLKCYWWVLNSMWVYGILVSYHLGFYCTDILQYNKYALCFHWQLKVDFRTHQSAFRSKQLSQTRKTYPKTKESLCA